MSDPPLFAALLRELRRVAGWTQEDLASRAGVGVRTLRDLEAGRATRPQRSTVDLLAEALKLSGTERARFTAAARGRPGASVRLRPVPALVGRSADVTAVAALLDVAEVITLVGLAGSGRASIALTVAHRVSGQFPAGVGSVSVTASSTDHELLGAAVTALGLSNLAEVGIRLTAEPGLLVLTGADRAAAAAAAAVGWLRAHGPRLRVIVTSRHPLGLPSEHEWAVAPLEVPIESASAQDTFAASGSALFLERLRRVRPRPVEEAEAPALGALVRRLGGLPSALEIAAARGRVLQLEEMLARAADPSDPAGQNVRESVLASWRLLTPAEQTCLCWLGVFERRWSIDLAEELLIGGPGSGLPDVVSLVDRLVGLGLVSVAPDAAERRFWLPEPVRAVSLQKAAEAGVLAQARQRRAELVARLAARTPQQRAAELKDPGHRAER